MTDERPGAVELTQLMGEVLDSDASEAFAEFMVRHMALGDLAPNSEDVVMDGVEASPDVGDAMARAELEVEALTGALEFVFGESLVVSLSIGQRVGTSS